VDLSGGRPPDRSIDSASSGAQAPLVVTSERAHSPKVSGSNPAPATNTNGPKSMSCSPFFRDVLPTGTPCGETARLFAEVLLHDEPRVREVYEAWRTRGIDDLSRQVGLLESLQAEMRHASAPATPTCVGWTT
jgi:hypothetical protein